MKIAILGTRGIPARYGGFETFAEHLAKRLTAHGEEMPLCALALNWKLLEASRHSSAALAEQIW